MNLIRRFAFTATLALNALTQFAGLAHAQDPMKGKFSLPYEVAWENTMVPAGNYEFSIISTGASEFLTLQKIGGGPLSFGVLVHPVDLANGSDVSEIVLVTRGAQTYVRSMQLAKYGVAMDFAVPGESARSVSKAMARTETMAAASSER